LGIVFLIGTPTGWQDLGVPGEKPSFLDLRSVTTAWDCTRRGIDVLPRNPCDPQQRPANYPRVWLLPWRLGLGEGATVPIGIAMGFLIGTPTGWQDLGVPGEKPSFLDLRSVTTAWDCTRRGIDVLPRNPCDPQQRPANYPRVWLLPWRLGLGEGATVPIGIAM